MIIEPEQRQILALDGWVDLFDVSEENLLPLARSLGPLVPSTPKGAIVDLLQVKSAAPGEPRSYSNVYGSKAFPFHTDCAYYETPPRYILLRLQDGAVSDRPTLMWDTKWSGITIAERSILSKELWKVGGNSSKRNGAAGFITPLCRRYGNLEIFRFDPNVMKPYFSSRAQAREIIYNGVQKAPLAVINWRANQAVVIDNWRMLHSRGAGQPNSVSSLRILQRILIGHHTV